MQKDGQVIKITAGGEAGKKQLLKKLLLNIERGFSIEETISCQVNFMEESVFRTVTCQQRIFSC
ncbi:hypothetical protein SpAn4DRAFT_0866 [Sporomusa ovata]|uniref:Uncharacterized protein n=1 Tax=Sporomusa ovata TaxID=2378 RepID=A0A0U1L690_9FIRM|nr:hypothetical protein SpAn4DRAFT_0866 [Sporomusa ovata]